MTYTERLINYEREKRELSHTITDYKKYETAIKLLAKKWRI